MEKFVVLANNYKRYKPKKICFLNSKYVDDVLGHYEYYSKKVMICNIDKNGLSLDTNGISFHKDDKETIIRFRIKIKIDDEIQNHVNLLILNHLDKTITRYEPLYHSDLTEEINYLCQKYFEKKLPNYKYRMTNFHPQKFMTDECKNMGLCVAHVIRYAIFHIMGRNPESDYDMCDIYSFASAITENF